MKKFLSGLMLLSVLFVVSISFAQVNYFPERHAKWEEKSADSINVIQKR